MKKVAVLGSGAVGETLANGFLKHGHEVMRASRDPEKLADWKTKAGDKAQTGALRGRRTKTTRRSLLECRCFVSIAASAAFTSPACGPGLAAA